MYSYCNIVAYVLVLLAACDTFESFTHLRTPCEASSLDIGFSGLAGSRYFEGGDLIFFCPVFRSEGFASSESNKFFVKSPCCFCFLLLRGDGK